MFQIELSKCRWTTQGIDPTHIFPSPGIQLTEGPILVSLMNDQNYFVHDGRHRCIRGILRMETLIDAIWLEDYDADQEAESVRRALQGYTASFHAGQQIAAETMGIPTGYKAPCGRDHLHQPHAFGEHMEEFCMGQPIAIHDKPRYDRSSPKALCGKHHRHDPHDASLPDPKAPEDWCDGIPK